MAFSYIYVYLKPTGISFNQYRSFRQKNGTKQDILIFQASLDVVDNNLITVRPMSQIEDS